MPVKHVLALGYYGFANAGDEAILTVLLGQIRETFPGATVTVVSGSPDDTAAAHGVDTVPWQDFDAIHATAKRADLMVLGGGGLFQDYHGVDPEIMFTPHHGDLIWAEFPLIARLCEVPLAVYAVGVGPLHTEAGKRYVRMAVDSAVAVSVRDQASQALLADLGVDPSQVEVVADPAFLLEPAGAELVEQIFEMERVPPPGSATIGVTLRPWREGAHVGIMAAALDRLVEQHDARVVFLPFQAQPTRNENDARVAVEVVANMDHGGRAGIVRGDYTAAQKLAIFASFDVAIAMRLHAAMFATLMGVPSVAIAYDPKVSQLMADLGRSDRTLQLSQLNGDSVVAAVTEAMKDRPVWRDEVGPHLLELKARAQTARSVLATAASRRPHPPSAVETALGSALLARAREAVEADRLRYRLAESEARHADLQLAYDKLAADRTAILDSRTMRLARSYWRAKTSVDEAGQAIREGVEAVGRAVFRAAPESFKLGLRRLRPKPLPESAREPEYGGDPELRKDYEAQLDRILEDHPGAVGYVVYPHSIGWRTSLFQRPQQMAMAFARLGYLVFYGLDHVSREGTQGFRQIGDRLFLHSIEPPLLNVLKRIPSPIAVTYVYNYSWVRHLAEPTAVFEHIDELEVFTATHDIGYLRQWFEQALTKADVVSASATDLLEKITERRPDAVLCPNGVDFAHFARRAAGGLPPDDLVPILDKGRPIVGYYGALAEWFDYGLMAYAAKALPDHEFVLIGPDYDGTMRSRDVFTLPNVTWLGVKDYADLANYLRHFDVATIPFVVNDVTHSVSPLKLFEYMAGGRPIVTTNLRECARYSVVQVAKTSAQFVEEVRRAVGRGRDPAFRELLRNTARANTWDVRAGTLIDAAARHHRA